MDNFERLAKQFNERGRDEDATLKFGETNMLETEQSEVDLLDDK